MKYLTILLVVMLSAQARADFVTGYLLGSTMCDERPVLNITITGTPCVITFAGGGSMNATLIKYIDTVPAYDHWLIRAWDEPAYTRVTLVDGSTLRVANKTAAEFTSVVRETCK